MGNYTTLLLNRLRIGIPTHLEAKRVADMWRRGTMDSLFILKENKKNNIIVIEKRKINFRPGRNTLKGRYQRSKPKFAFCDVENVKNNILDTTRFPQFFKILVQNERQNGGIESVKKFGSRNKVQIRIQHLQKCNKRYTRRFLRIFHILSSEGKGGCRVIPLDYWVLSRKENLVEKLNT